MMTEQAAAGEAGAETSRGSAAPDAEVSAVGRPGLPLGQVFSTASGLYTRHWPFMVGVAALVLICGLVAAILNLIPVLGTLLFIAAVGTAQGALMIAVVSKLRGVRPAMPEAMRAVSLQRLLEIVVAGGLLAAFTLGVQSVAGAMFLGMFLSREAPALMVVLLLFMVAVMLVSLYVNARFSYAALIAVDVSSPESEPFSRLGDAWKLTRGRVLKLVILELLTGLIFGLSLLLPVVGSLLVGFPVVLASRAAAYLAMRGEPLRVPEKLVSPTAVTG